MTNSDIKLITNYNAEELKFYYYSQREELKKIIETCGFCGNQFLRYINSDDSLEDRKDLHDYFEVSFDFHKQYFECTDKMKFANVMHKKLTGTYIK